MRPETPVTEPVETEAVEPTPRAKGEISAEEVNKEIIAYLQGKGDRAPEPGDPDGTVVNPGSSEAPFPATISTAESAGWVYIYNRETGDPSKCNLNMVPLKLREQRDGVFVWTLDDPGFRPKKGTVKCRLHPDDEDRAVWDDLGLPVCPKATLKDEYQLTRHMNRRHREEFAVMENRREKAEAAERAEIEKESRDFQRRLLETLPGPTAPQTLGASGENDCRACNWKPKPGTKRPGSALQSHIREIHKPVEAATL